MLCLLSRDRPLITYQDDHMLLLENSRRFVTFWSQEKKGQNDQNVKDPNDVWIKFVYPPGAGVYATGYVAAEPPPQQSPVAVRARSVAHSVG